MFDALHFAAKITGVKVHGDYPVGAALIPAATRKQHPAAFPSELHGLLEFVGRETMRLHLPVLAPSRVVVDVVHDAFAAALASATQAGAAGLLIPLSPVEHENTQLEWERVSSCHPRCSVPLCKYDGDCDALLVGDSRGPLPAYLTVAEQDTFDVTGEVPPMALFCLLCIRRDAQAFYLVERLKGPTNAATDLGRPTIVVPPFQNLVDVPGGYVRSALGVTPGPDLPAPVSIVGVMPGLTAKLNPYKQRWYVDQNVIVYGSALNGALN